MGLSTTRCVCALVWGMGWVRCGMRHGMGWVFRMCDLWIGRHETASIKEFSWGVANRGASVRVGNQTFKDGYGYMEDRRPASNMDPYLVTGMIAQTVCVGAKEKDDGKYIMIAEQTERRKGMSRSGSSASFEHSRPSF